MGVLTDYFRAADDDAARALVAVRELGPLAEHPGLPPLDGVEAKGVDPDVVLAALAEAITGSVAAHDVDHPLVWPDEDDAEDAAEGPWVQGLAEETRDVLASVGADDVSTIAARWATSEELDGATAEDLVPVVVELAALARRAVDAGERLYCWTCL